MADYDRFSLGDFTSPLENPANFSLLRVCDRPLYEAIAYFAQVLNHHLGQVFDSKLESLGRIIMSNLDGYADGYGVGRFVAQAIPYDPIAYFQEMQYKFPLLALFRKEDRFENDRSMSRYSMDSTWILYYILPPLTPEQARVLIPILTAVSKVINDRVAYGFDPSFEGRKAVWHDAQIDEIETVSARYDYLKFNNNRGEGLLTFHLLEMIFNVKETQTEVPELLDLDGITSTVQIDDDKDEEENPDPINILSFNVNF